MKPVIVMTDSKGLHTNSATIIHLPLIEIEPLPVVELADTHFDWLLFTSSNAVTLFFERYPDIQYDKVASIGKKTTRTLKDLGIRVDFEPAQADQETLIAEAAHRFDNQRICLPCSIEARPLLKTFLSTAGQLTEIPLYQPVPNKRSADQINALIEAGQIDAVTFMSPSAVRCYFQYYTQIPLPVAAIGHVTGESLADVGQPYIMADNTTREAMVHKLIEMGTNNEL